MSPTTRRLTVAVLALVGFLYFFPWQPKSTKPVDEMFGLLHLVTSGSDSQHVLGPTESFDPSKAIELDVYASGKEVLDWSKRVKQLNKRMPLVVFSKSYCPYSQRAKSLLATYDLTPAPKIIEVDLRDDATEVKHVLTRLTSHATFPNVVIRGESVGGSDALQALHEDGSLRRMLEGAGMTVRGDVP
ncbi:thioredoxin-like protein [Mycena crocata]|nr:thioredoxin-like protein [Mycena crocata]